MRNSETSYESEPGMSPDAGVMRAHQVARETVAATVRALPSANNTHMLLCGVEVL